jgi:hypothetical protein
MLVPLILGPKFVFSMWLILVDYHLMFDCNHGGDVECLEYIYIYIIERSMRFNLLFNYFLAFKNYEIIS